MNSIHSGRHRQVAAAAASAGPVQNVSQEMTMYSEIMPSLRIGDKMASVPIV